MLSSKLEYTVPLEKCVIHRNGRSWKLSGTRSGERYGETMDTYRCGSEFIEFLRSDLLAWIKSGKVTVTEKEQEVRKEQRIEIKQKGLF